MAVTAGGTPYVESTDLVANYPATSLSLANKVDTKVDYALPVNDQTGTTYTFVLADGLRLTTASNAAASTYTIPPQASVVWLDNSVIRLVNYGAGVVTVAGGSGVTVTNAATTLAQFESVALIRTGSDAWTLVPFSGGVSNADFSDAATGTYTDGGFNYKYITYTASGTLTVTTAGFADVLVVGGGGGGTWAGGGAGGCFESTNVYLSAGTQTVVIGAGGPSTSSSPLNGITSRIGPYYGVGGGAANFSGGVPHQGSPGGSGGGAFGSGGDAVGGAGTSGQGNAGGNFTNGHNGASGGGGATAAGGNSASSAGGAGGAGLASTITGSSVTYAGGGGGGGSSTQGAGGAGGGGTAVVSGVANNGLANTGGGAGGNWGYSGTGGAGGSGVVIVRVKV